MTPGRPFAPVTPAPLSRRATIGILGDGQLGRMLAQAAQRRGFQVHGFGQNPDSPLAQVTQAFTCAAFDDTAALDQFARQCDVVTSEFENVPLIALQQTNCRPQAPIFALAQDRLQEKQAAEAAGLRAAPFYAIDSFDDLQAALRHVGGAGILKTRRMGYDGKGQWRIHPDMDRINPNRPDTDLAALWAQTPGRDLILEGLVDFQFETSALIARNARGHVALFPCGQNVHRDGILFQSIVPGQVGPEIEAKAHAWAGQLAASLDLVGLLAIEFFVLAGGGLIFNEMAPRPHNSGHWTLEGCDQSQFDLAISALVNEDLRAPTQLSPAIMTNVLGQDILTPKTGPKTFWHDYGKTDPKPGRKMGHVTVLG